MEFKAPTGSTHDVLGTNESFHDASWRRRFTAEKRISLWRGGMGKYLVGKEVDGEGGEDYRPADLPNTTNHAGRVVCPSLMRFGGGVVEEDDEQPAIQDCINTSDDYHLPISSILPEQLQRIKDMIAATDLDGGIYVLSALLNAYKTTIFFVGISPSRYIVKSYDSKTGLLRIGCQYFERQEWSAMLALLTPPPGPKLPTPIGAG